MSQQEKNISPALRSILTVFLSLLVLATSAYAANYTNSLALPPGGNPPPLINLDSAYQEKKGGFWADAIGSTNGFCIGASCITAWPAWDNAATCHLDTMIKQNQNPGGTTPVGSGCTLSAAETAAGWIVQSWDLCSWVASRDCAGPMYCKYSRLSCSGSVTVTPGTLYRATPFAPAYSQSYYQGGYEGGYESSYEASYQASGYSQGYYQSYYQSSYGGGGGGGGCFSPDTLVAMADGTTKAISDVRIGDRVLSANDVTGERTISVVTKTLEHLGSYETILLNGITVTPEHKIKVSRGGVETWLPAGQVRLGDVLIGVNGNVPVTSIAPNENKDAVYNLTTFPSHTYFAGGVLVHNEKQ